MKVPEEYVYRCSRCFLNSVEIRPVLSIDHSRKRAAWHKHKHRLFLKLAELLLRIQKAAAGRIYGGGLRLEDEDIREGGNDEDKSESSVDEFENSSSSDDEADDDRDEDFEYASDSSEALQELLDVIHENAAWIYVNKSLPN
ncbi:unnamed protein product [Phytophthora fragariaefolia]|uniref:Unnamed protein product n=1 Tax=Phytophthora fragariaefolia TaxID=1490495 RepID=A0A9W7CUG0_9STRA|nr:unnamed protein product [Phytophthora fragariaefolia]